MKQEEILEYNKLCAEFLGLELYSPGFPSGYFYKQDYNHFYHFEDLRFHSDWNWIMEVVEAIEKIKLPSPSLTSIGVRIEKKSCRIFKGTWDDDKEGFISVVCYGDESVQYSKKEITIQAINQFLIWYNNENKTN